MWISCYQKEESSYGGIGMNKVNKDGSLINGEVYKGTANVSDEENDFDKELAIQLDMLMNTEGKYYMAYGFPYNGEDQHYYGNLRAARREHFVKWLKANL